MHKIVKMDLKKKKRKKTKIDFKNEFEEKEKKKRMENVIKPSCHMLFAHAFDAGNPGQFKVYQGKNGLHCVGIWMEKCI